jgi:hypothetical protein
MAALADAHLHLFSPGFSERYDEGWASADELARYEAFRAVHGIGRGLVVGMELGPFKGNNDHLAAPAADHPRMAPVAYVPVGAWPDGPVRALNDHRAVVSVNALPEASAGIGRLVDRLDGCTPGPTSRPGPSPGRCWSSSGPTGCTGARTRARPCSSSRSTRRSTCWAGSG